MSYENSWIYDNEPFESDAIGNYFGFVYYITNKTTGRKYIGRKYFWSFRTPPGKKRKVKQTRGKEKRNGKDNKSRIRKRKKEKRQRKRKGETNGTRTRAT